MAKIKDAPPYIHDLVILAKKAGIDMKEEKIKKLAVFTSFNIRGRYAKDKFAFYKLCTRKFAEPYYKEAGKIIIWLKEFYQKRK